MEDALADGYETKDWDALWCDEDIEMGTQCLTYFLHFLLDVVKLYAVIHPQSFWSGARWTI